MFLLGVHIQLAAPTCFYLSSDILLLLARSSSLMSSLLFWHIFILTFKQVPEILKSWINLDLKLDFYMTLRAILIPVQGNQQFQLFSKSD